MCPMSHKNNILYTYITLVLSYLNYLNNIHKWFQGITTTRIPNTMQGWVDIIFMANTAARPSKNVHAKIVTFPEDRL
jgi:hypothetical protein